MLFKSLLSAAVMASAAIAAPFSGQQDKRSFETINGVEHTVFEHAATGSTMKFVTNSGVCETTKGVNQYSGYLSVGTNLNMWFWFFEARQNPETAPLATWFNGGPGCSSMIGLFQENGPCKFTTAGGSTPVNNTFSWNNYANMLYIDQPIGVGFSYGTDNVGSTVDAAPLVWKLIQAFYTQFPKYENRDFGIFTESYGGHYGPEFAYYIEQQNAAIAAGSVTGQNINLVALGINNGWFDATLQYKAYVDYSYNNTFDGSITKSQYTSYMSKYTKTCLPAINKCISSGSNSACSSAQTACYNAIEGPLSEMGDFDVYDVRAPSDDPNPPETYATYLANSAVKAKIGATSTYTECANTPYNLFTATGDNTRSFLTQLTSVVNSGIQVLIWAGDQDWICNWFGGQASVEALKISGQATFKAKALVPYTVNGVSKGTFKTQANLSFARIFQAGHEVPFYQPDVALQAFIQTMQKKALFST